MEQALRDKLREQQHTERRLGHQTCPKTAEPLPLIQQTDRTVRHILPPRAPRPKSRHEQLLHMRQMALENR